MLAVQLVTETLDVASMQAGDSAYGEWHRRAKSDWSQIRRDTILNAFYDSNVCSYEDFRIGWMSAACNSEFSGDWEMLEGLGELV